ncbi:hypothetical protein RZS08_16040, partial [Arthrospira platensis SPKY1]|nr:hypothetical protein [Arthrospira platensis SPKY1]
AGSITLEESHKNVSQGLNTLFRQNLNQLSDGIHRLRVTLFYSNNLSTGGSARDGLVVKFSQNFSNDIFKSEDATKFANMDEDVAIQKEDTRLSIEGRNFPTDGEFIQLHNAKYRGTDYTYRIYFDGIPGVDAFLLDQFTQTLTPLNVGAYTFYNFTVAANNTATTDASRFR